MTKYREILRLHSLNFSERAIANTCHVPRNTVSRILKETVELNICWSLQDEQMTDADLENLMFPKSENVVGKLLI